MLDLKLNDSLSIKSGDLILSEPMLGDANFRRSVVLICEHSVENGSFGFVLNKPTPINIDDLIENVSLKLPVYYGGPVGQDKLFLLHRVENLTQSQHVKLDLYWGGDVEDLLLKYKFNQLKINDFKFLLGYSGWSSGQLEDELKSDSWIIVRDFDTSLLFDCQPDSMWQSILNELGGKYKLFAKFPIDPKFN